MRRRDLSKIEYVRIGGKTRSDLNAFVFLLIGIAVLAVCGLVLGCAKGVVDDQSARYIQPVVHDDPVACTVSAARYPTTAADFSDAHLLYGHRGFLDVYQNVKHLGRDVAYAEGMAIHPIACGTLRFYGPANGYGTLVAVVEHALAAPLAAVNGDGQKVNVSRFLSIYGHLRDSELGNGQNKLPWQVGDTVGPDDVIGFVQSDAKNGDGPEHLHSGIRLQGAAQAQNDDSAWFRGYDTAGEGAYKKYYADPAVFIPALIAAFGEASQTDPGNQAMPLKTNRHPLGTLLARQGDGTLWLVVEDDAVVNVTAAKTLPKKCAVVATDEEIACYWQKSAHAFTRYLDSKAVKFDGEPQVYQMYPANAPTAYRTFLSYDSFLSWGFADTDIEHRALSEKSATFGFLSDEGMVGFMPGALAKGNGQSEVAVADQHGVRRPLFNWDVFTQLGYDPACIYGIEASTLDAVAGPRSDELITLADTVECSANGQNQVCTPGTTVPCGCVGNKPGTQSCDAAGKAYGACVCQGGGGGEPKMCGTYAVGDVIQTPCCPDLSTGNQVCQANGVFSDCYGCASGAGGTSADSGAGGSGASSSTGGSGGSPQATCGPYHAGQIVDLPCCPGGAMGKQACTNQGVMSDCWDCATGTGGSSGAPAAGGSGGSSGSDESPDAGDTNGDDLVRIEYYGTDDFATLPKRVDGWFTGHAWSMFAGCLAMSAKDIVCEFHAPHAAELEFQISLGANRYWGDTSGLAPAPCIPAATA